MGEIRFVGTGETRGYPYLVCKKTLSLSVDIRKLLLSRHIHSWLVVLCKQQYFIRYPAVSQREGESREILMSKQPPTAPTATPVGPCPTKIQISRTPRHWKFTKHHRTSDSQSFKLSCIRFTNIYVLCTFTKRIFG